MDYYGFGDAWGTEFLYPQPVLRPATAGVVLSCCVVLLRAARALGQRRAASWLARIKMTAAATPPTQAKRRLSNTKHQTKQNTKTKGEESRDLERPAFSRCTRPLVLYSNYLYVYGEFFTRTVATLHAMHAKGWLDRR